MPPDCLHRGVTVSHRYLQAAEASSRLAAANAKMGNASTAAAAFHQQLPCICTAAPLKDRAEVLGAMADALLAQATEAEIQEHPDRYCRPLHLAMLLSPRSFGFACCLARLCCAAGSAPAGAGALCRSDPYIQSSCCAGI